MKAQRFGCGTGCEAMRDFTEGKPVWVNVDAKVPPWYPRG
jgi:aldehyde dehydrogenase (NAD+)